MRQKTILIVTPYFPPHSGGLERYAQEIAMRLHGAYEWRVIVVTTGTQHGQDYEEEIGGLKVYRLSYPWKLSNTPLSLRWFSRIRAICKIERPDIVNIHMPVPGIGDIAAMVSTTNRIVVTYHAGTMRKRSMVYDPIIFMYEQTFLRLLMKRARHIICSSDYVRDGFLKRYHAKSSTITPGVDFNLFHSDPKESHERPTILFVGSLTKSQCFKNLSILIRAVNIVREDIPDILLKVVGDGDLRPEYEALVNNLGISKYVQFEGYLTGGALVRAYQSCDVLALLSSLPAESFGMVLLEAMACGKPVIGARMGGIPTIIEDGKNGFLVMPDDMQSLCSVIKKIVTNPAFAAKMGSVGLKKAREGFSWEMKADQYDRILTSI